MKYLILTIGLSDNLISCCQKYFSEEAIEFKIALDIKEAIHILEKDKFHLLVLDMDYLRSMGQSGCLLNIRRISFIPMVVLSGMPEVDVGPAVEAGADVCFDSNLPPIIISILMHAQLRRYTKYNHFTEPETGPFQVGDIAIDTARHLVWVRGRQIALFPREFSLLFYFMQNPHIVLTQEQICRHAWKKNHLQSITQSIHDLRHKIEPDPTNPIYIQTVYRVGYCFTGYYDETCEN